jgi:integrase
MTSEPWRWIFALLLFTGARKGNVLAAKWQDFDLDRDLAHSAHQSRPGDPLPLSVEALAVLAQIPRIAGTDFLFPSHGKTGHIADPKKAWTDLLARAELANLNIHDLRRTFGSWQATTGASLPVIGNR